MSEESISEARMGESYVWGGSGVLVELTLGAGGEGREGRECSRMEREALMVQSPPNRSTPTSSPMSASARLSARGEQEGEDGAGHRDRVEGVVRFCERVARLLRPPTDSHRAVLKEVPARSSTRSALTVYHQIFGFQWMIKLLLDVI